MFSESERRSYIIESVPVACDATFEGLDSDILPTRPEPSTRDSTDIAFMYHLSLSGISSLYFSIRLEESRLHRTWIASVGIPGKLRECTDPIRKRRELTR